MHTGCLEEVHSMSSDMRNVLSIYTRYSVVRLSTRSTGGRGMHRCELP